MERRLGRGLGSLLSESRRDDSGGTPTEPAEVRIDRIQPNPFQPRTHFDEAELDELAASIRQHGILQPVALRSKPDGTFELIAGERRWRAAQKAGRTTVPAVVRNELSDQDMLELALVENLQRVDLHPMERAEGFRRMMRELELTQEGVADKVGLKRSTVANHLRLLDLPEEVQAMVAKSLLSMGHARAILRVTQPDGRRGLAERVVRQDLSVRETERIAREAAQEPSAAAEGQKASATIEPWATEMQTRIRERLGARVRVMNGADYRGQIVIDYAGRDELDRIYAVLAPPETI